MFKPEVEPENLFRASALRKRMEDEGSHELLTIVPNHNRLGFYFIIIVFLLILFWLFFGALPVEIKGNGIFMKEKGFYPVESVSDGGVNTIFPSIGSDVKEGDPLFLISNTKLDISLEYANQQLASLEAYYEKLKLNYGVEEEKLRKGLNEQIASNQAKVEKMAKQIPGLEEDYEKKKRLLKEALVSTNTILNAENLLLKTQTALEAAKSTIASLEANLNKTYHTEELSALEQRILKQKENRDILLLNKKMSQINSPFNAHVLEILVHVGEPVKARMKLMWIENSGEGSHDIVIYGFVHPEIAKRMRVGQNVYIHPMNINAQEFGALNGKITDISPAIVVQEQIGLFIHDKSLESYLTEGSPNNHMIMIKPEIDSSTISGFKWTSGKGIPFKIPTGMVCSISGVAYYERPIVTFISLAQLDAWFDRLQKWLNSWFLQDSNAGGFFEQQSS
ncbi:MAG: HlyD family efflux transporter periplasmic adaptor subunit [Parachlamydiaceae bacterium]